MRGDRITTLTWGARGAAVVLPLVVLAVSFGNWARDLPRPLTADAQRTEAAVREVGGPVLVVGNSKSGSDLDRVALGKALGIPTPDRIHVTGSSAPAWYAMLEQRVYARGVEPEFVIFYGQLASMLRVDLETIGEQEGVSRQLTHASAVLDAKVYRANAGARGRVRSAASAWRDAVLGGWKYRVVGALLAPGAGSLEARGKAYADAALGRVFGEEVEVKAGAPRRAIPVAEGSVDTSMTARAIAVEDTLLPDLVRLVRANGGTPVFVRAPMPSSQQEDAVPLAQEREALALLADEGVSYIDLHATPLPSGAFRDNFHASVSGRVAITAALAEALSAADVLGGGVARAHPPIAPTAVVREGALPTFGAPIAVPGEPCTRRFSLQGLGALLPEALRRDGFGDTSPIRVTAGAQGLDPTRTPDSFGAACAGATLRRGANLDVSPPQPDDPVTVTLVDTPSFPTAEGDTWWVYAGTRTRWELPASELDQREVMVEVRARGEAVGALWVDDVRVPLTAVGRVLRAQATLTGAGPWSVAVEAGPRSWLLVDTLRVGAVDGSWLVGRPPARVGPIQNLGTSPAAPMPLTVAEQRDEDGLTVLHVPGIAHLDGAHVLARIGLTCSPIQASAGDAWLAITQPDRAIRAGNGLRHEGDTVRVPPGASGRWSVRLDPARVCVSARWLYPRDARSWSIARPVGLALRLGADVLQVRAVALAPDGTTADVPLRATVTAGREHVEVETTLPTVGPPVERCLRLPRALPAGAAQLTIENPDPDTTILLLAATLAESEHLEGGCEPLRGVSDAEPGGAPSPRLR